MIIPQIFKYNSIISVPLFAIVALYLIRRVPDFSFHKLTFSKTIYFLKHPAQVLIFRLNFVVKALLDFGFALFILNRFQISLTSPIAISLILSAFLFGTLAYFIEGRYSILHIFVVYTSGVLWAAGQLLVAKLTGNSPFFIYSVICLLTPVVLGFGFLFARKISVFIQAVCIFIWYFWLITFTLLFL